MLTSFGDSSSDLQPTQDGSPAYACNCSMCAGSGGESGSHSVAAKVGFGAGSDGSISGEQLESMHRDRTGRCAVTVVISHDAQALVLRDGICQ